MRHQNPTLLQTKLHRPHIPRDLVERTRLLESLGRGSEAPLALVCAPDGYPPKIHLWVDLSRDGVIYHVHKVNQSIRKAIPFDRPATYRISVQGRIDPDWSDLLAGMRVGLAADEAGHPVTILDGELSDQAALAGVLNTLYEMHLPILSVMCQPDAP